MNCRQWYPQTYYVGKCPNCIVTALLNKYEFLSAFNTILHLPLFLNNFYLINIVLAKKNMYFIMRLDKTNLILLD